MGIGNRTIPNTQYPIHNQKKDNKKTASRNGETRFRRLVLDDQIKVNVQYQRMSIPAIPTTQVANSSLDIPYLLTKIVKRKLPLRTEPIAP